MTQHQQLAADLSKISTITKHFQEYISFGYYPMVFQNRENLYDAMANVIDKTVYEDIANFYRLKTENLNKFKRILSFLASTPPGNINTNNLANHLAVDNKTAAHYLTILQRTGMVELLYSVAHGNQILNKPDKAYLNNTTLLASLNTFLSCEVDLGAQRELVFLQSVLGAGLNVFYPKQGDFFVNDIVFEVGGRNKTWQQLSNYRGKKVLVKDNMLVGFKNEIPLYLFGFLY